MSHTYAWVLVHVVFGTKDRLNLIPDVKELCRYLTGVARAKDVTLLAVGGTSNHVHLLVALNPSVALSKIVQEVKGNSSRWLGERAMKLPGREGMEPSECANRASRRSPRLCRRPGRASP